ncbi:LysR substrate-binding domain-containing protein [Paraburkholderia sp. WC7.3g]|uniref:LysR substrate-binding domain-containing protein n=1 Tax=Paraburkholderia sp. WC7.3g TaxID=2991070 RepID=UPI003D1D8C87
MSARLPGFSAKMWVIARLVPRLRWVGASDFIWSEDAPVQLVALPDQCPYRRMAIDALAGIGRASEVVYTCTSLLGVEAAIAAGAGLAILGQSSLLRNRGLRALAITCRPARSRSLVKRTKITMPGAL